METCRQIGDGYIRLSGARAGESRIDREVSGAELIATPPVDDGTRCPVGLGFVAMFRRIAPDATVPSIKSLNYLNNILARLRRTIRRRRS